MSNPFGIPQIELLALVIHVVDVDELLQHI
jgi:hypothetical protein